MEVSPEMKENNRTGFAEFPEVREILGGAFPRPELVNFLIGAAFIGNGGYSIQEGMTDSRTRIDNQEAHKITLLGLIQLIKIAEGLRGRKDMPEHENYKVMHAAHAILSMSKSQPFHFPQPIISYVEDWGLKTWKNDWTGINSHDIDDERRFFKMMHTTPSGKPAKMYGIERIFIGPDFVGNGFGVIMRELNSTQSQNARLWDDFNDLVKFRKPYLQKSPWQGFVQRFSGTSTATSSQQPPFIKTLQ